MPSEPEEAPDVELGAVVRAERLRFHRRPDAEVRVRGEGAVSESERHNLPDPVEPGVDYRDVRVAWRAAGRVKPTS